MMPAGKQQKTLTNTEQQRPDAHPTGFATDFLRAANPEVPVSGVLASGADWLDRTPGLRLLSGLREHRSRRPGTPDLGVGTIRSASGTSSRVLIGASASRPTSEISSVAVVMNARTRPTQPSKAPPSAKFRWSPCPLQPSDGR